MNVPTSRESAYLDPDHPCSNCGGTATRRWFEPGGSNLICVAGDVCRTISALGIIVRYGSREITP